MGAFQALQVSRLLEGEGLARKSGSLLLSGLGARLSVASALPRRDAGREFLGTRLESLDRLLGGGLPKGTLVEVTGRRSCGRFSIGFAALAAATSKGEAAGLVDLGSHLDPQAAEAAGVDLRYLLWARPEKLKDALAAGEMLLGTGFPLVVLDLGLPPLRGRFVPDAAWVRLKQSAEARGSILLLSSPYRMSGVAAEAAVAADAPRVLWRGGGLSPRLLSGISSRLTLERGDRARAGRTEALSLSVSEVLSSQLSGLSFPEIRNSKFEIRNSA